MSQFMRKLLTSMAFVSILATIPVAVKAAEGPWAQAEYLKARIVTEKTAAGKDATLNAGLEIVMEPEWHIYWRMPGDGGLTPELNWKKSTNLKDATLSWPAPVRFELGGLYGFGYQNSVFLPVTLTPENPGAAVTLTLHANIMVCKDLCVPQNIDLSLDIPAGDSIIDTQGQTIAAARKNLPYTENRADMKIENVVLGPKAIVVRAYLAKGFDNADLFVEIGPDFYVVAKPEIMPDEKDSRYASLVIAAPEGIENIANEVMDKTLTLTLTKDGKALERRFKF